MFTGVPVRKGLCSTHWNPTYPSTNSNYTIYVVLLTYEDIGNIKLIKELFVNINKKRVWKESRVDI